jgi:2-polyprenyl-3-methyl-5-hydroxy-6-metoxy-1,4-benzoquinol methylase
MVYANPVAAEFASGQFYNRTAAEYYLSPAKLESDYAPVRFEREVRFFHEHCPGGAILDIGCSSGAFLYQLNRRFPDCYDLLGMDASGPALDYAESRGVPVVRGHFLQADFRGKQFGAVTFWAVLEHLADPLAFIEKTWTILKPQGLCFILVPNLESLAMRLLGRRYRNIYPQHLNYFTKVTLNQLISNRFALIEFRFMHFNPLVLWQDWQGGGRDVPNTDRAQLLKQTTAYKQNPWLWPIQVLYRLSEKTLASFNLADNLAVVLRRRG